jgi:AcrR family transcriptional regulator
MKEALAQPEDVEDEIVDARPRRSARKRGQSTPERPSRRQEIFDHAILLMREKGFVGTSVQDLADRLEFSKANFYYHIKSKEEMLYRISFETLEKKLQRINTIVNSDLPHPQRMRAMVDCFVHLVVDHAAVISVYFEEKRHLSPAHLRKVIKLERQIFDAFAEFYREGVTKGYFRDIDPSVAVLGILGMCFWMTKWYQPQGRLSAKVISEQFNAILSDGYLLTK